MAPKAAVKVPGWVRVVLQVIVFGSSAVAVYTAGQHALAPALAVLVVLNASLIAALHR